MSWFLRIDILAPKSHKYIRTAAGCAPTAVLIMRDYFLPVSSSALSCAVTASSAAKKA